MRLKEQFDSMVNQNLHWKTVLTIVILFGSVPLTSFAQSRTLRGHTYDVDGIAFSPDGLTLASGSDDNTVRLWDPVTGAHRHTLEGNAPIAFSPDGLTLASMGSDNTVRLWDAATGAHRHTLEGHTGWGLAIAFSPDGRTLASMGSGTVRLWDPVTGAHRHTLARHTGWVNDIAFSPDGLTLASGGGNNTVSLWDAATGAHRHTLEGHTGDVNDIAFSPDGLTLASGSEDGTVRLWDPVTGARLHTSEGHTGDVNDIAFSPDGRALASGSGDNTMRLWDAATGAHRHTLEGHTAGVNDIAFSPDGRTLASGSEDRTVRLWDLTPPAEASVRFLPSQMTSPAAGAQFNLSLRIGGGVDVAGYQATVSFDSTALRYVSYSNGDYLADGAFQIPAIVEENRVTLSATSTGAESRGDGTLATLTFEVIAAKNSLLSLSNVLLSNGSGVFSRPWRVKGARVMPMADVNGDGAVNMQDLAVVAARFGQRGENSADVNGDRVVNIADLVLVAAAIGRTAAAPSAAQEIVAAFGAVEIRVWLAEARALRLTDDASRRGILFLEQLLSVMKPTETALLPNYPNPFNPETWIPYQLRRDGTVTLTIYDATGAPVRLLNLGSRAAGFYTDRLRAAYWDGRNGNGESVASGVYFYRLSAGEYSQARRMAVVK